MSEVIKFEKNTPIKIILQEDSEALSTVLVSLFRV